MTEPNKLNGLEKLISDRFSDNLPITRISCKSFLIFWNLFSESDVHDEPNIEIRSIMNCLPLFYVIVTLENDITLKLMTYHGKELDRLTICDINVDSMSWISFIERLSKLKLCKGTGIPYHDLKLDAAALCSSYWVDRLDSKTLIRSQQCSFAIEDGDVCDMCSSVNKENIEPFDIPEPQSSDALLMSLKCDQCPFQSNNPKLLSKHHRISHSKTKPYMCQKCPFSSHKYLSIMKHIDRAHEKMRGEENHQKGDGSVEPAKPLFICEYICRACTFKTTKSGAITKHIRRAHEIKEPYRCEFCTKSFSNSGIMNVHVRSVHLKEKRYKCQDCSYESYVKHSVTKHIKFVHDKVRSYACENCAFVATTKSVLENHVKRVHEKIKPFSCIECAFKAATNYHLKRHILSVHQKLKPHKCNQCEYSAAVADNLSLHIKHVHEKIKEHKCQYCSYETTRKGKLLEHVNNSHNTVIQVVENVQNIGQENIQIPIEGIELKFFDKAASN